MNKKFTRIFSLLIVFLLSLSFYPGSFVKAEENDIDINKMIEDNYWIDFKTVDKFGKTYLVPEGADLTEKSFLRNLAENDMDTEKMNYNTGFRTDRNALFDVWGLDASFWVKESITRDYSDRNPYYVPTPDGKQINIFEGGKANNPLNFDIDNKTIVNTDDYNMYADLINAKNNNTNSVDKFRVGDNFDLDFVVDTSILTKYQNTRFLGAVNVQGALSDVWLADHGIALADDIYVFNLDFPKGIDTNEMKLELEGLEGYTLETQTNKVGDRIKVRVVADEDKERDIVTVKDFFDELNNSTERIILRIKNLKINSAANTADKNQIKASFGGMHDLCMTYENNKKELETKDISDRDYFKYFRNDKECFIDRNIISFAAKQSDAGRDYAADKKKQNLISYTFNVEDRKASHNPVVTFINDDRYYDEREVVEGTSINQNSYMPRDPEKRGYKFIEWNTKPDGTGMTFTGDTVVYEDMTVYAIYKKDRRYDDERETADEEPMLNINDHYQYMVGYKDATFRPNNNMTREEAAVMFSRLMVRRPIKGHIYNHNFKDIANTRWSATAISYMNELGLIKGYPDGTFKPEKSITRAEFAAMATRFANLFGGGLQGFVDVPYTHWANDVIAKAASAGWVSGYPDGTFKPENKITRAEVVSITNRMLTRRADKDFITKHRSAILRFTDTPTHWAFYDIAEACNGHDYTRQGTIEENWLNVNLKTFVYDK